MKYEKFLLQYILLASLYILFKFCMTLLFLICGCIQIITLPIHSFKYLLSIKIFVQLFYLFVIQTLKYLSLSLTNILILQRGGVDWTNYDKSQEERCSCGHTWSCLCRCLLGSCGLARQGLRVLVEHKYFQQGILLAILINTLSMGIEYHNQVCVILVVNFSHLF